MRSKGGSGFRMLQEAAAYENGGPRGMDLYYLQNIIFLKSRQEYQIK